MKVFVDTSALYAVLDADDANNPAAATTWRALVRAGTDLLTHNYVLVEAALLVRRRLGPDAATVLVDTLAPALTTVWIDAALHDAGLDAWRAGARASLVDHVSFVVMRRHGIDVAFAFDSDFVMQGFRLARGSEGPRRLAEAPAPYGSSLSGASDLVGVAEIAARSGHPASTIQSWRRRHRGFPMPFAHLASGPVWHWPAVDGWIRADPRRPLGRSTGSR
jgi:predicted nucleic acid-binding protein